MAATGQHHVAARPTPTIDRQPLTTDHAGANASGKKANIQLSQPTRVGCALVEPGYYRVQMQREGERHVHVLARQEHRSARRTTYGIGAVHCHRG